MGIDFSFSFRKPEKFASSGPAAETPPDRGIQPPRRPSPIIPLNMDNRGRNKSRKVKLPRFPPGFRFNPRDDELITHYLRNKIEDKPIRYKVFNDVNILDYHPEMLYEKFKDYGDEKWLFFTPRDKKYGNGSRPNRMTSFGHWRATGTVKTIESNNVKVGTRRALVFYNKGNIMTDWVLYEYLTDDDAKKKHPPHHNSTKGHHNPPMQLNKWVLSMIRKKRNSEADDESDANEEDDQSAVNESGSLSSQPPVLGHGGLNMRMNPIEAPPAMAGQDECSKALISYSLPAQNFAENYNHQSQEKFITMNSFDEQRSFQQNNFALSQDDRCHLSDHDLQMPSQQFPDGGQYTDEEYEKDIYDLRKSFLSETKELGFPDIQQDNNNLLSRNTFLQDDSNYKCLANLDVSAYTNDSFLLSESDIFCAAENGCDKDNVDGFPISYLEVPPLNQLEFPKSEGNAGEHAPVNSDQVTTLQNDAAAQGNTI